MDVTILYFDGCPHWRPLEERLLVLADEMPDLRVHRRLIDTAEEAVTTGFHGSPSILVDGVDPFAQPGEAVGLSCRIYQTPQGPAGCPTVAQLRAALIDS